MTTCLVPVFKTKETCQFFVKLHLIFIIFLQAKPGPAEKYLKAVLSSTHSKDYIGQIKKYAYISICGSFFTIYIGLIILDAHERKIQHEFLCWYI